MSPFHHDRFTTVPREEWPEDPEYVSAIEAQWVEPYGDRRQELVFIGQGLDKGELINKLDECLLTDEELQLVVDIWKSLLDPFPAWME